MNITKLQIFICYPTAMLYLSASVLRSDRTAIKMCEWGSLKRFFRHSLCVSLSRSFLLHEINSNLHIIRMEDHCLFFFFLLSYEILQKKHDLDSYSYWTKYLWTGQGKKERAMCHSWWVDLEIELWSSSSSSSSSSCCCCWKWASSFSLRYSILLRRRPVACQENFFSTSNEWVKRGRWWWRNASKCKATNIEKKKKQQKD